MLRSIRVPLITVSDTHPLQQATSHASHFHTVSAQAQTNRHSCRRARRYGGPKIKYWFSPTFITDWHIIQSISLRTRSFRPSPDGSNSPGAKFHLYLPRLDRMVSDSTQRKRAPFVGNTLSTKAALRRY
jgi:hypothetical protein